MSSSGSLRDLIDRRGTHDARRPFLFAPDDNIELSYGQLRTAARDFARCLKSRHGIGKDDCVGLFLPNGADFLIAYLGTLYLGAVACPINTLLQDPEIEYILQSACIAVVCTRCEWVARLRRISGGGRSVRAIVPVDELRTGLSHGGGLPDDQTTLVLPALEGGDLAQIVHTSGSTGRPKGVMLTHRNLILDCQYIVQWHRIGRDDRAFCILPLVHTNAEVLSVLCSLYAGASVVVPRRFHASQFWPLALRYGVTWCSAAPTIFYILIKRNELDRGKGHHGHRIRFFISGSSPLPVPLLREFEQIFGVFIFEGYGLTETVCRVAFNPHPPDDLARPGEEDSYRKFGSVGTAIGDTEIAIVDDDDRPVECGERGEIVLRGSVLMKGYFNDDVATAEAFRGGWFHTGDIGYLDTDGYLYIVDRKKDMIIRGGQNIYPREVDNVLALHPKIAEAAVIGVPDEKYGEEVKAYVVLKEGEAVSPEDIINFCRERLAAYKCPKTMEFINAMPKGPTGKLLRAQLAHLGRESTEISQQEG